MIQRKRIVLATFCGMMLMIITACGSSSSASSSVPEKSEAVVESAKSDTQVAKEDEESASNTTDVDSKDDKDKKSEVEKTDLNAVIKSYLTDGELTGKIITADFNNDGKKEEIAEAIRDKNENGFQMVKQVFIYTDGNNTYEFEGNEGQMLYETKMFAVPIDEGYHFAYTSDWRYEALGGEVQACGVYKVTPTVVKEFYSGDFSSVDSVKKNEVMITFYEEPTPGSIPINEECLYFDGDEVDWEANDTYVDYWTDTNDGQDFVIQNSDSCYLTANDLSGLTDYELRLARNEIYARHGRLFNDAQLQNYFNSKSWYTGSISPDDWKESYLNEYEKANANLILEYENR